MRNVWLLKHKFPVTAVVRVKESGGSVTPELAGRVGEVTNIFHISNWVGVYFGGGPAYVTGKSWNVFFPEDLEVMEGYPRLFEDKVYD